MFKKIALAAAVCFVVSFLSIASVYASDDIVKIGSDVVIAEGTAIDDIVVIAGDLTLNGTAKNVAVIGGNLYVGETGKIIGDSAVIFGKTKRGFGQELGKNSIQIPFGNFFRNNFFLPILGIVALGTAGLMIFAGFFLIVLLIAYLFTGKIGTTSFYIQTNFGKSLLYGFLVSLCIAPIIFLLTVSILGIPLIPIFVIAVFVVSIVGYTAMCQLFGLKFFNFIGSPNKPMVLEVIVGLIIMCLLIMIPYIGWIIKTLIWLTGLGATVATGFGKK